jgi:glutathione peroxidase-family protein
MLCYGYEKKVLVVMFDNSTNINKKETMTYDVGNPVFGVKLVNGTQPSPLNNWISKENKQTNKNPAHYDISFHSERPHTITKMSDNINVDKRR